MSKITDISTFKKPSYAEEMEAQKRQVIQSIECGDIEPDEIANGMYYNSLEGIYFKWANKDITAEEAIKEINSEPMLQNRPEYSLTHAVQSFIEAHELVNAE